jgi:hypothetical protein
MEKHESDNAPSKSCTMKRKEVLEVPKLADVV